MQKVERGSEHFFSLSCLTLSIFHRAPVPTPHAHDTNHALLPLRRDRAGRPGQLRPGGGDAGRHRGRGRPKPGAFHFFSPFSLLRACCWGEEGVFAALVRFRGCRAANARELGRRCARNGGTRRWRRALIGRGRRRAAVVGARSWLIAPHGGLRLLAPLRGPRARAPLHPGPAWCVHVLFALWAARVSYGRARPLTAFFHTHTLFAAPAARPPHLSHPPPPPSRLRSTHPLSQALVDAPGQVRRQMNFKRLALTDFKIDDLPRAAKQTALAAAVKSSGVFGKFAASAWGQKLAKRAAKVRERESAEAERVRGRERERERDRARPHVWGGRRGRETPIGARGGGGRAPSSTSTSTPPLALALPLTPFSICSLHSSLPARPR